MLMIRVREREKKKYLTRFEAFSRTPGVTTAACPCVPSSRLLAARFFFFLFLFQTAKTDQLKRVQFGLWRERKHGSLLYLFLFQKSFCQLSGCRLKLVTTVAPISDQPVALLPSLRVRYTIHACPLSNRLPIVRFSRSQFLLSNAPLVSILSTVPHTHKVAASWLLSCLLHIHRIPVLPQIPTLPSLL